MSVNTKISNGRERPYTPVQDISCHFARLSLGSLLSGHFDHKRWQNDPPSLLERERGKNRPFSVSFWFSFFPFLSWHTSRPYQQQKFLLYFHLKLILGFSRSSFCISDYKVFVAQNSKSGQCHIMLRYVLYRNICTEWSNITKYILFWVE